MCSLEKSKEEILLELKDLKAEYEFLKKSYKKNISNFKKSKKILNENEKKYHLMFENSPQPMWIYDLETLSFLEVNQAAVNHYGYTKEEFLNMNIKDIRPKEEIPALLKDIENISHHINPMGEWTHIKKNGEKIIVEIIAQTVIHNSRKARHILVNDITNRKQAEQKLRESEIHYRALFENTGTSIIIIEEDATISLVNNEFLRLTGYSRDEIENTTKWNEIVDSEDVEWMLLQHNLRRHKPSEALPSYEFRFRTKSGELRYGLINAQLLPDSKRSMASIMDITVRKQNEEIILKLSKAVEFNPASIVITDKEGCIEYVNPKFCSLSGYSYEELIGKNLNILKNGNTPKEYYRELWDTILSGNDWHGELYNKKKNGEFYWENVSISPIKNSNGSIINFVAVKEDISERKLSEKTIREKNEQQQILINNLPALIYFKDSNLKYKLINESFAKILKLPINEIIGKTDSELNQPEIYEKIDKELIQSNKSQYDFEIQSFDEEGNKYWTSTTKVLYSDEFGKILGIIGIVQDITERKKAEDTLKESEERYRVLFENTGTAIIIIEEDTTISLANEEFLRRTGYSREEVERVKKWTEIVYIDDVDWMLIQHNLRRNNSDDAKQCYEFRYSTRTGDTRFALLNVQIIPGTRKSMASLMDITVRKHAEEQIIKLSRAIEYNPASIVITDNEGNIEYVNPKFCDLSGYDLDEVIGKNPKILKSGFTPIEYYKVLWDTILSGKDWHGELYNKKKNGEFYWENVSISPIKNSKGIIINFVAVKEDITERKISVEALKKSEEKFRSYIDFAPHGIFIADENGNFIEINNTACKITGYNEKELLNKNFVELIDNEYFEIVNNIYRKVVDTGFAKGEFAFIGNDNTKRYCSLDAVKLSEERLLGFVVDITESKLAEESFRKLALEKQVTLETVTAGISHIKNRKIEWANAAHDEMFGYTVGKTKGMSTSELYINLDSYEEFGRKAYSKLEQGELYSCEYEMRKKNGAIFWCCLTGKLVNKTQAAEGSIWMIQDITNRKHSESLLNQIRQNYETFFNTIDDLLFVLDSQGNIIHTNETVEKRLGYLEEELIGKSILIVHPEERREEAARIVGEILDGKTDNCQIPVITKKGIKIPVETRVSNGFWDGQSAIFGVTKDITNIKLSEEKFSKVFFLNPSACALSDINTGEYIEVNEAFYSLLGFDKNEVLGKNVLQLGIMSPKLYYSILDLSDVNGNVTNEEAELIAKNGDKKHVLLSSENIFVQDKKYRFTVINDITERKNAEQELNNLYDDLIASNEIIEANLYQKNVLLDELTLSENNLKETIAIKDKFFSIVAHDLRGPFSGFLGLTDLMAKEADELSVKDIKRMSEIINKSANSVYKLIEDLLLWSRIQTGVIPFVSENLDLFEIAFNTMFLLNEMALTKNIKLIQNIENNSFVFGDRNMITTTLRNLISNAIKFTNNGGIIEIGILKSGIEKSNKYKNPNSEENKKICIYIKDNGIGISLYNLEKIFKVEEHLTTSGTNNEQGTGLGLIICKEFVEKHGGSIWVESEEGIGSTFYFTLPKSK